MNASIIELAGKADVSPPTVTRFCRRLGCESFSDFKVQLARTPYVGMRYLKPEPKSQEPGDVAQDIITKAQNALFLLHRSLDLAAIERAADRLAQAEMIYAFGSGGNSSMIAGEFQNRLFRLGLRITASSDHSMQMMMAAAARPADVIVGSSFSGRNAEMVRAFTLAREAEVPTIALTRAAVRSRRPRYPRAGRPAGGNNIYRPTSTRIDISQCSISSASLVPIASSRRRRVTPGASSSSWWCTGWRRPTASRRLTCQKNAMPKS